MGRLRRRWIREQLFVGGVHWRWLRGTSFALLCLLSTPQLLKEETLTIIANLSVYSIILAVLIYPETCYVRKKVRNCLRLSKSRKTWIECQQPTLSYVTHHFQIHQTIIKNRTESWLKAPLSRITCELANVLFRWQERCPFEIIFWYILKIPQ